MIGYQENFKNSSRYPKTLNTRFLASQTEIETKLYEKQQQSLKTKIGQAGCMVKIHPEGHIQATFKSRIYQNQLDLLEKDDDVLPDNKALIKQFIYDLSLGKTNLKGSKRDIGESRITTCIRGLRLMSKYFNKPFKQVEMQDMERFVIDLKEGRFKGSKGKSLIKSAGLIKALVKQFYKWLLGNNRAYPELVEWIGTSTSTKEYIVISEAQLETALVRMTSNSSTNLLRNRALFVFLFDSGLRADELLNIRLKHLSFEDGNYKVRVEFSKTKKRTLSLPLSKKYLDEWLDVHPASSESLAQLFPMAYNQLRLLILRIGMQINVKGLTPHSLRHSSATYWARHLSQYQLCYRFGWSMNSSQPARYIDREGLDQEKTIEVVKTNNVERLAQENSELNKRLALLEDQMERLLKDDKEELLRIIETIKQKAKA